MDAFSFLLMRWRVGVIFFCLAGFFVWLNITALYQEKLHVTDESRKVPERILVNGITPVKSNATLAHPKAWHAWQNPVVRYFQ